RLLNAFLDASVKHDVTALKEILHQDVIMYTDGGGRVSAAVVPVRGPEKIIAFLANVVKGALDTFEIKPGIVNGPAGALLINKITGITDTICTLETDRERITGFDFVRNPEKISV